MCIKLLLLIVLNISFSSLSLILHLFLRIEWPWIEEEVHVKWPWIVLNKGVLVLSASCDNTTTCTALFLLLFAFLLKSCRLSALNMKPNQLVAPFPVNHLSCRLLKFLQSCSHLSCPSFDVGFNKKIFLDCHWRQSIKCKRWYLCNGIQLSHWCCFVIPWMELGEIIGDVFPFLSFRWHLNFFF